MLVALTNHLWQSTIFALAAALLTIAFRKNRAHIRYALWLAASLKFLVPFAFLIALGTNLSQLLPTRNAAPDSGTVISQTIVQIAQPVSEAFSFAPVQQHATNWLFLALIAVWGCGFFAIGVMRFRAWCHIRTALRSSTPIDIPVAVEVRSAPGLLEPGVVGIFRPKLLLPEGILESLTPLQLETVVAHELAHIRRRDNLTAALHMLVEAIFWFHPIVWWIGARLIAERERACDEAVISLGNQPRDYAEAILQVCKLYVESPLACISGVTGSMINARVRAILARHLGGDVGIRKKLLLASACFVALLTPIMIGMMIVRPSHAQSETSGVAASHSAASANIKARTGSPVATARSSSSTTSTQDYVQALGTVTAISVVVRPRMDGQLTSVNFKEGSLVKQGQVLASLDAPSYNRQLQAAQAELAEDQAQLDAAAVGNKGPNPQHEAAIEQVQQLRATVKADQDKIQFITRAISNSQIVTPITGIAGFLQVDEGNVVHPGQALVVINQLQPIAAIFSIDQSYIPKVLALQRNGASPAVELLDRDNGSRIAVGHLTAVDNEIDATTDTVKLKAEFDNKNGALFPNELVNARMDLKPR